MKCFRAKENGEHSIVDFKNSVLKDLDEHITISEYHTLFYTVGGKKNKFFEKFGFEVYGDVIVIKNNDEGETVSIENNFAAKVKKILENDVQKRKEFLTFLEGCHVIDLTAK